MKYKKGIIWLPSIKDVDIFHFILERDKLLNVKILKSTSKFNSDDDYFSKDALNNCIMLACDKFTTGFDGKNMEFGINFRLSDSGYRIIQKLGRFSRFNEGDDNIAYFFQFCQESEFKSEELIDSIFQNMIGLGTNVDNIDRYVFYSDSSKNTSSGKFSNEDNENNKIIISLSEIKNKIKLKQMGGYSKSNIKKLINSINLSKVNSENLLKQINESNLIDSKKKIEIFLKSNNINFDLNDVTNWIRFSLGERLFEELKKLYYFDKQDIIRSCNKLKITNCNEYKKNYFYDKKLPTIDYIDNGIYNDIYLNFNLTNLFSKQRNSLDFI